ncbi:uncharacterized protein wu:fj16a03 [Epinephelus fuscoguttatus]|uniref:uncharacterized protein wu:fj16a03 n=1 Tax=Epinephelus fuscoguttatus TaxID=293821 RepID=UPI0020D1B7F2|nr:uncharacterized protein wu:fj16a03 [Epinephelus fuscoguttatus]
MLFVKLHLQQNRNMKVYLLLMLLLPILSAQASNIKCYGEDSVWVRNMLLDCGGPVKQACYTRASGEKGCTTLDNCQQPGWTCCYTDGCNI